MTKFSNLKVKRVRSNLKYTESKLAAARQQPSIYESISMTKFSNLKVKRVRSNLKYTESKLVKKKDHVKRKKC